METKVLDHGYVHLIETWGQDSSIIEAARMSTAKGFLGWGPKPCPECAKLDTPDATWIDKFCKTCKGTGEVPGDEKLLRYLWEHKHHTPFEMAGLTVEVQAPIFVFREWHRHRTQSYNELSARYTPLPDLYYIPSIERVQNGKQSGANKQGSEAGFTEQEALDVRGRIHTASIQSRGAYERLLEMGLSRELARLVIPVNQYSRMRASSNLRNWLGFLGLRCSGAAQLEIRLYANAVGEIIEERFPRTYELFKEGQNIA